MVIRIGEAHVENVRQRAVLPNVAAVIEFVKLRRKTTREKAVNFERREPIPDDFVKDFLRKEDANRAKYNPLSADLKILYPDTARSNDVDSASLDAQVNSNFSKDKEVLNEMFPTIIPPDSYFEKGELDLLESTEHPLRYPAKSYISKK
jgi:hypothetical protein